MKTLYVITKSVWGGAGKYVYDLATSLPKDRFEAVVAAGGNGPLMEKLAQAGIRTVSINSLRRDMTLWGDAASLFSILSVIRRERPDVVHVNSSKTGGLGAFAAQILGVKRVVFTCHGWPFNEDRRLLSLWAIRFFSWLTMVFSDVTIAVSERDLRDGERMPFSTGKLRLVHNGIAEPAFKEARAARAHIVEEAAKHGMAVGAEDFLIGAIGELHKNKGYDYLLPALAQLRPTTKLAIIGNGEEKERLEARIAELGLRGRVALLGFVSDAASYLRGFDAFVQASIKEGLPYTVIEAGYAGLPVVATNVGGVKEIIEDMRTGILVQTRKPEDLAQGLKLLSDDRSKAQAFGAALREATRAEFSLEKMMDKTIQIYEPQR
ncbi:MAG TPA: glycosyltransferase family 4 protein [Candidatus Paceibacterota bacterium]|nr:glycosyltransferase family 4 protein [Candidatus Paceibacterota bacterium]